ncbi:hypothetical protein QWA68_013281 [Fusarium oxysporum]|nr:hypothetical protein QWA68_013281 [Fusarium oxysporum]
MAGIYVGAICTGKKIEPGYMKGTAEAIDWATDDVTLTLFQCLSPMRACIQKLELGSRSRLTIHDNTLGSVSLLDLVVVLGGFFEGI